MRATAPWQGRLARLARLAGARTRPTIAPRHRLPIPMDKSTFHAALQQRFADVTPHVAACGMQLTAVDEDRKSVV